MDKRTFAHLVEIDQVGMQVVIYRVFPDGEKQLYTKVDVPKESADEDRIGFEKFSRILGENLLLDSPVGRRLLGL